MYSCAWWPARTVSVYSVVEGGIHVVTSFRELEGAEKLEVRRRRAPGTEVVASSCLVFVSRQNLEDLGWWSERYG